MRKAVSILVICLLAAAWTCQTLRAQNGSPAAGDTLHVYLTADYDVYVHWDEDYAGLDITDTDAKRLRNILSGELAKNPGAFVKIYAALSADPGIARQVAETVRFAGAKSLSVNALTSARRALLDRYMPGSVPGEESGASAVSGYTLTVLVYPADTFIYYLNESYPDIQFEPFDTAQVKQRLAPFADAKIAVKIHDKASAATVKKLFAVFNELEIVDFAFFIWTPEEESLARQRLEPDSGK